MIQTCSAVSWSLSKPSFSRMLKNFVSVVLASLTGSTYGSGKSCSDSSGRVGEKDYASPPRSLRPCRGQGASRRAGAGRVRRAGFLNILRRDLRYVRETDRESSHHAPFAIPRLG